MLVSCCFCLTNNPTNNTTRLSFLVILFVYEFQYSRCVAGGMITTTDLNGEVGNVCE